MSSEASEGETLSPLQRVEAAADRHKMAHVLWKEFCDDTDLELLEEYFAMLSLKNALGEPVLTWSEKWACINQLATRDARSFEQFLWEKRRKYGLQMIAIQSSSAAERRAFDWKTFDVIDDDLLRSEEFMADDPEWAGLVFAHDEAERKYEEQEAARQRAAENE